MVQFLQEMVMYMVKDHALKITPVSKAHHNAIDVADQILW